jgi:hypothetical protein
MFHYSYFWLIPQVLAMIHYFRNRPEGYWFWIILFFGPLGAVIYFFAVVLSSPTSDIEGKVAAGFKERRRASQLQAKIDSGEGLPYEYYELGEILFRLKKYEKAAELLTKAVEKSPENKDARYSLALALERLGRYEQAGRQLEPLVVEDSMFKFGGAMLALARCYKSAGEIGAAVGAFRKVLSQSRFPEARYTLAELLIEKGELEEAKKQLETLITDAKTSDIPAFSKSLERKWSRKAKSLLATVAKSKQLVR